MDTKICASTSLYLGVALIVSTALISISLNGGKSHLPVMLLVAGFVGVCFCLSEKRASQDAKKALAISGAMAALLCHAGIKVFLS